MQDAAIDSFKQQTINDAPANEVDKTEQIKRSRLLDDIIKKLQIMAAGTFAVNIAAGMVGRSNAQNKSTITSTLKLAFGIDAAGLLSNKVVRETLELAVRKNVNLISSIQTDFIKDIGDVLRSSILEGHRHTDMIKMIRERGEVSQSRARLIARDQTAKINSDLTRGRHESLGIGLYQWGGAGDERERDAHREMNGKLCRYDDPTVYSDDDGKTWKSRKSIGGVLLHPGEDYQCRCVQLPYVQINDAA